MVGDCFGEGEITAGPEQGIRHVAVGVDEPGHHDRPGGVDHLGIASPEIGTDLGDPIVLDEDVGLGVVADARIQTENAPTLDQGSAHRRLPGQFPVRRLTLECSRKIQ
jgi:hypothetical protein